MKITRSSKISTLHYQHAQSFHWDYYTQWKSRTLFFIGIKDLIYVCFLQDCVSYTAYLSNIINKFEIGSWTFLFWILIIIEFIFIFYVKKHHLFLIPKRNAYYLFLKNIIICKFITYCSMLNKYKKMHKDL